MDFICPPHRADVCVICACLPSPPSPHQALLLSFSGIVGACLLAFIIKFKGEDLQKIVGHVGKSCRHWKLHWVEEGGGVVGADHPANSVPHCVSQLVEEAYSETTALKEKLGATEDKEGEILVGFKG